MDSTRTRIIPLSGRRGQGLFTLVDEDDYAWLASHTWHLSVRGGYATTGVTTDRGTKTKVYMHQLLITPPPGYVTDHINRHRLDNRRSNLRVASRTLNRLNSAQALYGMRRYGRHGELPRGCSVWLDRTKGGTWAGCIDANTNRRYIKRAPSREEAVDRVLELYKRIHGS